MEALIESCRDPSFPAQVSVVLSNRPESKGIEIAQNHGLLTEIVDHKTFPGPSSFEAALQKALARHPVDLICLAGFMRLLSPEFVQAWPDKIINIHPSLLPDYKGLNTHERVLADGRNESGCTVHFVRPAMDAGPVIIQKKIQIKQNDTPETLAGRILEQEHVAYPEAVRFIGENRVRITNEQVTIL